MPRRLAATRQALDRKPCGSHKCSQALAADRTRNRRRASLVSGPLAQGAERLTRFRGMVVYALRPPSGILPHEFSR